MKVVMDPEFMKGGYNAGLSLPHTMDGLLLRKSLLSIMLKIS